MTHQMSSNLEHPLEEMDTEPYIMISLSSLRKYWDGIIPHISEKEISLWLHEFIINQDVKNEYVNK